MNNKSYNRLAAGVSSGFVKNKIEKAFSQIKAPKKETFSNTPL